MCDRLVACSHSRDAHLSLSESRNMRITVSAPWTFIRLIDLSWTHLSSFINTTSVHACHMTYFVTNHALSAKPTTWYHESLESRTHSTICIKGGARNFTCYCYYSCRASPLNSLILPNRLPFVIAIRPPNKHFQQNTSLLCSPKSGARSRAFNSPRLN